MKNHKVNVWLVNTGWIKGGYSKGERIKLKYSRAIIQAIYNGSLAKVATETDPVFGFKTVSEVPEVPSKILIPRKSWKDKSAYDTSALKLAALFQQNFKKYQDGTTPDIIKGGPQA